MRRLDDVLGQRVSASFAAPVKRQEDDANDAAGRAWSSDANGITIWCVVSGVAQRFVLECALDGPGAQHQTAVERTIVGECMQRLLSSRVQSWREAAPSAVSLESVWRCDVSMVSVDARSARLSLYAPAEAVIVRRHPGLADVPLELVALLDPVRTAFGHMTCWQPGTRLMLGVRAGDLRASLSICDGLVVNGHVGVVDGFRAIRLSGAAGCGRP
ncbi:MAG: hypothetical protein JO219_01775 [Candidatus Eremiobacteraeota bacterium]|nr:hypothetical protein [Candidatus Eremiobacteraeota bacterium]